MTKLKTGDRVVPERFGDKGIFNVPPFSSYMEKFVGVEGEIQNVLDDKSCAMVHDFWWPLSALAPVKPKWEPVTGQKVEFTMCGAKVKGEVLIIHLEEVWVYSKELKNHYTLFVKDIRPIAPLPAEKLRNALASKLWGTEVRVATEMADMLMPIILEWHNRHKEGEGR